MKNSTLQNVYVPIAMSSKETVPKKLQPQNSEGKRWMEPKFIKIASAIVHVFTQKNVAKLEKLQIGNGN